MATLLISDLHLPATPSPLRDAFLRFLDGPARQARALYILGDLFEYWIGDAQGIQVYGAEVAALRRLHDAGVALYYLHGNRDFLVGAEFARASGVQILHDPALVELEGQPTLLSHGDLFCLDDVRYQRWRRVARNPLFQKLFLSLPLSWRERIAGGMRATSTREVRNKPSNIMDVAETAIHEAFNHSGARRLIHGHTHRPDVHGYDLGGRRCERLVLADWRPGRMEALRLEGDRTERIALA